MHSLNWARLAIQGGTSCCAELQAHRSSVIGSAAKYLHPGDGIFDGFKPMNIIGVQLYSIIINTRRMSKSAIAANAACVLCASPR